MSDSMIERMARAMHAYEFSVGLALHEKWEDMSKTVRDAFMAEARAALDAMQEPTEAMVAAAKVPCPELTWGNRCNWTWRVMIAAAKEEEPRNWGDE